MAAWIKMPHGVELGGPGDFVLDGDPGRSLPKKGAEPPPKKKKIRPMFIVAKRLDRPRCHLEWR